MKKFRKINEAEVQDTEQPSPEQKSQGQVKSDKVETAKELIKSEKNLATFLAKFGSVANDEKVQRQVKRKKEEVQVTKNCLFFALLLLFSLHPLSFILFTLPSALASRKWSRSRHACWGSAE